jgi:hypothetical protein
MALNYFCSADVCARLIHFCSRFMIAAFKDLRCSLSNQAYIQLQFVALLLETSGRRVYTRVFVNIRLFLKIHRWPRILSSLFWLNDQCYYFTLHAHSLEHGCPNENDDLFNSCLIVKSAIRFLGLSAVLESFCLRFCLQQVNSLLYSEK